MPMQRRENAILELLDSLGVDPKNEAFRETPLRAAKAWGEWTRGYGIEVGSLFKTFDEAASGYDGFVVVHNIEIVGMCPHHLAPIRGLAHVGYIPSGRVLGLSKFARVAEACCARLVTQEEMARDIADAFEKYLEPVGVGVLIRADHACMTTRGVRSPFAVTTTSAMRGALLKEPETRAEFLQLCSMAEREARR